jgi:pimeloyl-ACP methyl ester carboxylesterase
VITYLQQSLDRAALRLATASVSSGWRRPDQSERAAELLARPDLLAPEVNPARLQFTSKTRFTFQSQLPNQWEDPTAPGILRRAGRDWNERPAIILIHGWNGELGYYLSFPWLQAGLAFHGVTSLAFELPFHASRRSKRPGAINNLISDDVITMIEGIRQCLADILSLRLWLLEQGCPSVSLWGYSLGGWLAGLLTAHPQPFKIAVLMNAVARMDVALQTLPFAEITRQSLAIAPVDLDRFSLHHLQQMNERTLIMQGLRDLFVPPETLDDLAVNWPKAELWPMRHSHISICLGPGTLFRAIRWVARHLNA